ncbi:MAG: ABC transporter substrate-binding protein, partial [Oscillospiraceae bacterium]|nr:ABC transporter substrate-binding protein [Oscillospiraceae bacterium]
MKRRLAALLCALALSLSLAGCWSSDVSDEGNDFWEEPPEQEADNSPLTPITSFALPYLQGVTLDPLTCPDGMQQVLGALLYEGLFALDESFAPQNVLCSRYERSDDGTSYTFYLRDDASFSDGSALTANDALATL